MYLRRAGLTVEVTAEVATPILGKVKVIPVEDALKSVTGDLLDLKAVAELAAVVLKARTAPPPVSLASCVNSMLQPGRLDPPEDSPWPCYR